MELLAWDSRHFGFSVAAITDPTLDQASLRSVLGQARDSGVCLVYWSADPEQVPVESLLQKFGGRFVSRQATFRIDLPTESVIDGAAPDFQIAEHPPALPAADLLPLAIASGEYSRFRTDSRLPKERFESMYEIWITRSTLRELADAVFTISSRDNQTVGLITVANVDESPRIDLLAVDVEYRRRGLGRQLLHAGHDWMVERGARQATVTTQLENRPACALYQRCGYRLDQLRHYYHFWTAQSEEHGS